ILTTIWPGFTDFRTSAPTAFWRTRSVKERTTSSATSASTSARRTSRSAAETSASDSAPRPVRLFRIAPSRSCRFSNIRVPLAPASQLTREVIHPRPRLNLAQSQKAPGGASRCRVLTSGIGSRVETFRSAARSLHSSRKVRASSLKTTGESSLAAASAEAASMKHPLAPHLPPAYLHGALTGCRLQASSRLRGVAANPLNLIRLVPAEGLDADDEAPLFPLKASKEAPNVQVDFQPDHRSGICSGHAVSRGGSGEAHRLHL